MLSLEKGHRLGLWRVAQRRQSRILAVAMVGVRRPKACGVAPGFEEGTRSWRHSPIEEDALI